MEQLILAIIAIDRLVKSLTSSNGSISKCHSYLLLEEWIELQKFSHVIKETTIDG